MTMRGTAGAIAVLATLAGCGPSADVRAADAAEQSYAMVTASGTLGEQCRAAEAARDAWLAALDRDNYERWGLTARINCATAAREGGYLPADRLKPQRLTD